MGDAGEGVPLGTDGLFYIDGLPAGRHDATVESAAGNIRCTLDVPTAGDAAMTDLGVIACEDAR
jgi:hypothetical protein